MPPRHTKTITNQAPVVDPHGHQKRFEQWNGTLPNVQAADADLIRGYIADMQDGINVSGKRGRRSTVRLNTIRSRMTMLSRLIQRETGTTLVTIPEEDLLRLFSRLRRGSILKADGQPYKSVGEYSITYKAFWHWYMRRERRRGNEITDKTIDLDTSQPKPQFHYLTPDQVKQLADHAKPYYRMLLWFLFDAGCRAPKEMMNVRVTDLTKLNEGIYQLEIRDETSKTFGRKIKLLLCSDMLATYIAQNNLQPADFLFTTSPGKTNKYLGRLGHRVLGIGEPRKIVSTYTANENGKKVEVQQSMTMIRNGLTMYDLRHASACHWLPKYKSESALKYRFGWKNSDMIHYYTEFLGMKDTITQDDLIDADDKNRLQRELDQQRQQHAIVQEQFAALQEQLAAQQKSLQALMDGKIDTIHHQWQQTRNGQS